MNRTRIYLAANATLLALAAAASTYYGIVIPWLRRLQQSVRLDSYAMWYAVFAALAIIACSPFVWAFARRPAVAFACTAFGGHAVGVAAMLAAIVSAGTFGKLTQSGFLSSALLLFSYPVLLLGWLVGMSAGLTIVAYTHLDRRFRNEPS